ncbi:MAG TPA: hypothetical protein VHL34_19215, partial [Rhizomicrobium sp.]|nr:hypothetical protein [Rhizomicrobium sp.]
MTVTTSYSQTELTLQDPVIPTFGDLPGSDSALLHLANGGWVALATDTDGFSDLTFYDAAGNPGAMSSDFNGIHGHLAQLSNGNVVLAGDVGGVATYRIFTPDGTDTVKAATPFEGANYSNPSIAALSGGGFVIATTGDFGGGDHDIDFAVYDSAGTRLLMAGVDNSTADDENASVVALSNGTFAIGFERLSGGSSAAYISILSADGTTYVLTPTAIDSTGTINRGLVMAATQDGGFTVVYEDNESGASSMHVSTFDASGELQHTGIFNVGVSLSEAAITTLSSGLQLLTFTDDFYGDGSDVDTAGLLWDPVAGAFLTGDPYVLAVNQSTDNTGDPAIIAMDQSRYIVSYTDQTTGTANQHLFQLVRTSTADDDSSVTINGDDAVDHETGLGGDDTLNGGANDDVLTGGGGADTIDAGTGHDTIDGGSGFDTILMGANLDAADVINGGPTNDNTDGAYVVLNGDYTAGVTFTATTMTNVGYIQIMGGAGYKLIFNDATVGAGETLTVDASFLHDGSIIADGSAESDGGNYVFVAGAKNDTLKGGNGWDEFRFGAKFTDADKVDGGAGIDTLDLNGDYHTGVKFKASTMTGVETIRIHGDNSYKFITTDANVAAGSVLTIDNQTTGAADKLIFNGGAETDGGFDINGSQGNDTITGGA